MRRDERKHSGYAENIMAQRTSLLSVIEKAMCHDAMLHCTFWNLLCIDASLSGSHTYKAEKRSRWNGAVKVDPIH